MKPRPHGIRVGEVSHDALYFRDTGAPHRGYWRTWCGVQFERVLTVDGFQTLDGEPIKMRQSVDCMTCLAER